MLTNLELREQQLETLRLMVSLYQKVRYFLPLSMRCMMTKKSDLSFPSLTLRGEFTQSLIPNSGEAKSCVICSLYCGTNFYQRTKMAATSEHSCRSALATGTALV